MLRKIIMFTAGLAAMLIILTPAATRAVTFAELQATIASLQEQLNIALAQLADLQGTTTPAGGTVAGCAISSFDRNLKAGMTGDDVKCLQIVLNSDSEIQLAASGVGSSGEETTYFGPLTKSAVIKFQEKYAQDVLAPWELTKGNGYVGSTSRAKLNFLLTVNGRRGDEQGGIQETGQAAGAATEGKTEAKGTGLIVSLAIDTPASTSVIVNQALAPLAKFTFTNNDNKEIKITQLRLKRMGLSAKTTLSKIYLFEGANRLTDPASVSSLDTITFNNLASVFEIAAGSSKTITVYGDIAGSNGETVGVAIETSSNVVTDASAVGGNFPIKSNLMDTVSITLATVDFNSTTIPAAATIDPQSDYRVWENTVTITGQAVNFTRLSLKRSGTINNSQLENFRLYVNNVQLGSSVPNLDSNNYVTFDLSVSPQKLEIGVVTIKVVADIIGASSKTFTFSLKATADANFSDVEYGANVLPTANSSTFSARTSGTQTVNTGALSIARKPNGPVDVITGRSAETIGEFTISAGGGESVKITSLEIEVLWHDDDSHDTGEVTSLRNGRLLADGEQVGSATSINVDEDSHSGSGTTYQLSSSLIVEPGNPVTLEVVADIYDNDGLGTDSDLENDDTLQVNILIGSGNAETMTSNIILSVPSSAAVTGQTVELEQGELDLAKYTAFSNKTYAVPKTNVKLGEFTLTNSHEEVNLTSIVVTASVSGAVTASTDLSNIYLLYGGNSTVAKHIVSDSDNTWLINYQLEKHVTLDIAVYADVASCAYDVSTTDQLSFRAVVKGTSVDSGTSVTEPSSSYRDGQTITFSVGAEGDLTGKVAADSPLDRIIAGSSPEEIAAGNPRSVTAAKYKFVAVHDDFLLKTIRLELSAGENSSGAVLSAVLKEGGTIVKDKNGNDAKKMFGAEGNDAEQIEFNGLEISIPANTSKTLTFDLLLNTPDSDISPTTSQANVQLFLDKIKYENGLGEEISDKHPGSQNGDPAAHKLYVYKSIPTFTYIDLGDNLKLYNGNSTKLYSFKVAADSAGDVSLKQVKFALNWDDNNTSDLYLENWKLKRGNIDLTGADTSGAGYVTIRDNSGNMLMTDSVSETDTLVIVVANSEEIIPAGEEYTYSLYATPSGFDYSNTAGADAVTINLKGGSDESAHNGSNKYLVDNATTELFALNSTYSGDGTDYNLIWSDNSSLSHSYSANNSHPDWANGYLVLNLPLDSEAWRGQ